MPRTRSLQVIDLQTCTSYGSPQRGCSAGQKALAVRTSDRSHSHTKQQASRCRLYSRRRLTIKAVDALPTAATGCSWQTWRLHSWPHWCKSKSSFSRANESFLCCATMRKNYLHACSSRTSPMADLSALDVHMMHHRILHSKGTYMLLHKHPLHCQLHEENTNPAEYTNPADKNAPSHPGWAGRRRHAPQQVRCKS